MPQRYYFSPNLCPKCPVLRACSLFPLLPLSQTPPSSTTPSINTQDFISPGLYKIPQFQHASSTLSLWGGAVWGGPEVENRPLTGGKEATLDQNFSLRSLLLPRPPLPFQSGGRRPPGDTPPEPETPPGHMLTSVLTASSEGLIRTTVSKTSLR